MEFELEQGVFINAPDWVKSASADNNGEVWWHDVPTAELKTGEGALYSEGAMYGCGNTAFSGIKVPRIAMRFGVPNGFYEYWQNSAIDREAAK